MVTMVTIHQEMRPLGNKYIYTLCYISFANKKSDITSIDSCHCVSTMIFIDKVIGLSTICKVMNVNTHIVFMTGNI
jgi:hypothetical protein